MLPKHILIAEDDSFLANTTCEHLVASGYRVTIAEDGQKALDILEEKQDVDLVLLDLLMPVKDGFAVLKNMKSNPLTANIKIIVNTNLEKDIDVKQVYKMGADEYIAKAEFDISTLLEMITNLLEKSSTETTN